LLRVEAFLLQIERYNLATLQKLCGKRDPGRDGKGSQ
jgi:hypothetical protein